MTSLITLNKLLIFSLIVGQLVLGTFSCMREKKQTMNEEFVSRYVNKSLGEFLDGLRNNYDSWTPVLEEGGIVGCSFHYEDNDVKFIYVAFKQPPAARISMSGDWTIQELRNEIIKGYAIFFPDTVIRKNI